MRLRWGEKRFREIFRRTMKNCLVAKVVRGEVVHIDASLVGGRCQVGESDERHAGCGDGGENGGEEAVEGAGQVLKEAI